MRRPHAAFILVGPTAVGKTAIVHELAMTRQATVLSADSMAVYEGMDIGTAKPTIDERKRVDYRGIDLVKPDVPFSTGDYVRYCEKALEDDVPEGGLIITGGSGLYLKALLHGFEGVPTANVELRNRAEKVLAEEGVAGLQAWLKRVDDKRYAALDDPQNPRRLIRALELAEQGAPIPDQWARAKMPRILGLRADPGVLRKRIELRVAAMYEEGLMEEARSVRELYPALSDTARQAIGYAECWRCIDGEVSEDEARAKTVTRTAQLAKKQMTWFRNQAEVEWIDVEAAEIGIPLKDQITSYWEQHGPTSLAC